MRTYGRQETRSSRCCSFHDAYALSDARSAHFRGRAFRRRVRGMKKAARQAARRICQAQGEDR